MLFELDVVGQHDGLVFALVERHEVFPSEVGIDENSVVFDFIARLCGFVVGRILIEGGNVEKGVRGGVACGG